MNAVTFMSSPSEAVVLGVTKLREKGPTLTVAKCKLKQHGTSVWFVRSLAESGTVTTATATRLASYTQQKQTRAKTNLPLRLRTF